MERESSCVQSRTSPRRQSSVMIKVGALGFSGLLSETLLMRELLGVLMSLARPFRSLDRHLMRRLMIVLGMGGSGPFVGVCGNIVKLCGLGVRGLRHRIKSPNP